MDVSDMSERLEWVEANELGVDFELGVKENSGLDSAGLGDLREFYVFEAVCWADSRAVF